MHFIDLNVNFFLDIYKLLTYVCGMIEFNKNLTCGCLDESVQSVKKWVVNDFYNEVVYLVRINKKWFVSKEKPPNFERCYKYEDRRFTRLYS